ncbi:MAG: vWA domain-containing protein [Candidatus Spechtbacterales bacterium]|nr:vWA domain-containing protein [Candidatus Spechtbacterales bacterium]
MTAVIDSLSNDLSSIVFGNPQAWYLLLAVPVIILIFWNSWRKERNLYKALHQRGKKFAKRYVILAVIISVMISSLSAIAAQPEIVEYMPARVPPKRSCIMLIDVSNSMEAWDNVHDKTNLEVAADTAWEVIKGLSPARCQIFAYSGAFLDISEFTDDYKHLYDTLYTSFYTEYSGPVPERGSDLPNALRRISNWLQHEEYEGITKIILLSDGNIGENQGPLLEEAIRQVTNKGLSIVPVGIGSLEGQRIHRYNIRGELLGYAMANGVPRVFYLEEANLKKIAGLTGERYFHQSESEALIEYLLESDSLGKTSFEKGEVLSRQDYSWIFLIPLTLSFAILLWRRKELY